MLRRMSAPTPEIADTPLGPVQYATLGEGAPVLVVHGTPGGWDQALAMARWLERAGGVRAILPSRPGYLGTPLDGRAEIDAQADLHAALLDHLGVDRVGVLCWSGGGPSSYRLAVRHPERVGAIVALAAVSKPLTLHQKASDRLLFGTRFGDWILNEMAAHAPKQLISGTLGSEGALDKEQLKARTEEVFADDDKRQFVLDLDATVRQGGDRRAGFDNDLVQFAAIEDLELERVRAPALIVQGTVDTDVLPEYSDFAAEHVPGAELLPLETGTHLAFFTHPDSAAAQARALTLLRAATA
jgi:pimeloyl-ACP methyl ester carboxylesterase